MVNRSRKETRTMAAWQSIEVSREVADLEQINPTTHLDHRFSDRNSNSSDGEGAPQCSAPHPRDQARNTESRNQSRQRQPLAHCKWDGKHAKRGSGEQSRVAGCARWHCGIGW